MKPKRSENNQTPVKEKRRYCPGCLCYLDGKPVINDFDGTVEWAPMPGWQFHRTTTGSFYSRIGIMIPCACESGREVQKGMFSPDAYFENEPWYDIPTRKVIERKNHRNFGESEPDSFLERVVVRPD